MKKQFLFVVLFMLANFSFAEDTSEVSILGKQISLSGDILAFPLGITTLLLSIYAFRFNRLELSASYRESIIEWYGKCIEIMELLRIGTCDEQERKKLIARLSALSEEGRFIFPNIDKGDGENSSLPPAFQGHDSVGRCYLNEFLENVKLEANEKDLKDSRDKFTSMLFQIMKVRGFIYAISRESKISYLENRAREDVEVFDVQD